MTNAAVMSSTPAANPPHAIARTFGVHIMFRPVRARRASGACLACDDSTSQEAPDDDEEEHQAAEHDPDHVRSAVVAIAVLRRRMEPVDTLGGLLNEQNRDD